MLKPLRIRYYYTLAWMDGTEVVLPDREGELRM